VKPTPMSALLHDDMLLDRVGARLDTDDDLGSLLLAVAYQADTPIPRAAPTRRRRPHRGLTVLAALGVAVSGATVAAAVELAPVATDQASGAPHLRGGLPRSLQALVLPFLAGTPFQGRLVLPFGGMPAGPVTASLTAEGFPAGALPSVYPMGDPVVGAPSSEDLSDPGREKTQGKGTPNDGTTLTDPSGSATDTGNQGNAGNQGNQGNQGDQGNQGNEGDQGDDASPSTEPVPQPKPPKTPEPPITTTIPTPTPTATDTGTTGDANGQNTGHNGQGQGRGAGEGSAGTGTTGTGTTGTGSGTTPGGTTPDTRADGAAETDDPASRVPPKGNHKVRVVPQPPVSGAAPAGTTNGTMTDTAASTGTAGTTTGSTSTTPAGP
jgi:hypothetical protein